MESFSYRAKLSHDSAILLAAQDLLGFNKVVEVHHLYALAEYFENVRAATHGREITYGTCCENIEVAYGGAKVNVLVSSKFFGAATEERHVLTAECRVEGRERPAQSVHVWRCESNHDVDVVRKSRRSVRYGRNTPNDDKVESCLSKCVHKLIEAEHALSPPDE